MREFKCKEGVKTLPESTINIQSWHTLTVCGQKGTGKSNLEKWMLTLYKDVYIFDTNGEFGSKYPTYEPTSDSPEELDKVAKALWKRGNVLLLVSEAELFLPNGRPLPPNIFKIVTRGRHQNIGLIADTRRIANLSKTVFGLSDHCFIFRHFSPTDIRYIQEFVPTNAKQLANLPDYHFWHYTKGRVEERPPVPNVS